MSKFKDLTGMRFGRLTPYQKIGTNKHRVALWLCKCDCGNEVIVNSCSLRKGDTKSCGCLFREMSSARMKKVQHQYVYKHGASRDGLFHCWQSMKDRCYNPNNKSYYRYGGRGIIVCNEWRENFVVFRDWALSHGYQEGLSIDRIDVDGNYGPENCQWLTRSENSKKMHRDKKRKNGED